MPEYKNVANKSVIKTLSLDPANSNKTFEQILEDVYGNSVTGKRTMETSTPRGGKDDTQTIDKSRLGEKGYFNEIKGDPALKKKYNEGLIDRMSRL